VAYRAVQCAALWELLSFIHCLFSVKGTPISKLILHFDYIYDPLSIKINVEMGEMLI